MLNFVGALALTYWLSRMFLYLPGGWKRNAAKLGVAHLASLMIVGLLLFWKTDAMMLPWLYIFSQGLWLLIDVLRLRRGIA